MLRLVVLFCVVSCVTAPLSKKWSVEVIEGGKRAADTLASNLGLINRGQVSNLKDVYYFEMPDPTTVGRHGITVPNSAIEGYNQYHYGSIKPSIGQITSSLLEQSNVGSVDFQMPGTLMVRGYNCSVTDPNWEDQWSLKNTGQLIQNASDLGRDLNVERAWLQGLTGCGIVVAIVDNGVEYMHPDLKKNYVFSLQYDFLDRDNDPLPKIEMYYDHGTNVAGTIGMEKGNNVCGIGVAYNSFITGLRVVSESGTTDLDQACALGWQNDEIDIYSSSWGPEDDMLSNLKAIMTSKAKDIYTIKTWKSHTNDIESYNIKTCKYCHANDIGK